LKKKTAKTETGGGINSFSDEGAQRSDPSAVPGPIRGEAGACCLDEESGLYSRSHFESVLGQEVARLDRWERPLSLVLLEMPELAADLWPVLGRLVRDSLRRIDLAARLGGRRVAVILPDADGARGRRWLMDFLAEVDRRGLTGGRPVASGRALALPWEGRQAGELLQSAEVGLYDCDPSDGLADEAEDEGETFTAIAADERNLLFDGFKTLGTKPRPGEPPEA